MIFGYIKYRPRNVITQILSSMKLMIGAKRERLADPLPHVEFRPVPEIDMTKDCVKCDLCIDKCPTEALSYSGNDEVAIVIDRDLCRPCKLCVEICPTQYFDYKKSSHSQVLLGKRVAKLSVN